MSDDATTIPHGKYYVVCGRVSHYYGTLTLQYKGQEAPVVLIPFGSEPGTLWNITTHLGGTQTISPDGQPHLQAVSVDGVIKIVSSRRPGWVIKTTDGTSTISHVHNTARWEVQLTNQGGDENPVSGGQVTVGTSSSGVEWLWWFFPVPTC